MGRITKSSHAITKRSVEVEVAPTSFLKFLWVRSIDLKNFGVKRSTFGVFEVMAILDVFFDYFRRFFFDCF